MSKTSLILTILGEDRPGLVDAIAEAVTKHGGNWVESRMAHLAGQFAGILRVEVEADQTEALTAALGSLAKGGLESTVHAEAVHFPAEAATSEKPAVQLSLVGQDRPGIVREISRVLALLGVNVEELNTKCTRAANTGQSLFQVQAQLRMPEGLSTGKLRTDLEEVAADMMVDIEIN